MLPVHSSRDLSSLFYANYNFLDNSYQNITLRAFSRLYLFSETRFLFELLNPGRPKAYSMCNQETTIDCEYLPMTGARSSHGATSHLLGAKQTSMDLSIALKFTVEVKFNTFLCTDLQKTRPGRNSERTFMSGFLPITGSYEVYARDLFLKTQPAHVIYSSYSLPSLLEQFSSFLSWTSLVAA